MSARIREEPSTGAGFQSSPAVLEPAATLVNVVDEPAERGSHQKSLKDILDMFSKSLIAPSTAFYYVVHGKNREGREAWDHIKVHAPANRKIDAGLIEDVDMYLRKSMGVDPQASTGILLPEELAT